MLGPGLPPFQEDQIDHFRMGQVLAFAHSPKFPSSPKLWTTHTVGFLSTCAKSMWKNGVGLWSRKQRGNIGLEYHAAAEDFLHSIRLHFQPGGQFLLVRAFPPVAITGHSDMHGDVSVFEVRNHGCMHPHLWQIMSAQQDSTVRARAFQFAGSCSQVLAFARNPIFPCSLKLKTTDKVQ